ncbi:MAG: glycosyltransferase family 39 protein [Candidatus Zixiibacteriota bacterium]|jgi:hypothetical protein
MRAHQRGAVWFGGILLPAVLFAVGVVFRLRHLCDAVRYDEAFAYLTYVRAPLAFTFTDYGSVNNHFLYSLFMRLAVSVFGDGAAWWRLPSLAAGLGTMALAAIIARRWFGPAGGVAALFVTAVSPVLAHFSVLARGHALSLFLVLTALYFVDLRYERPRHVLFTAAAAVSCALACFTIPTALLPVSAVCAYDAYRTFRRRAPATTFLALWLPTALLTLLLYLPLILLSDTGIRPGNLDELTVPPLSLYGLRPYVESWMDVKTWGLGGAGLWTAAAVVGLVAGAAKRPAFGILAGASLLGGAAFLAAGFRPPERVFLYLLPVVALGVGAAAAAAYRKVAGSRPATVSAAAALVLLTAAVVGVAEREGYLDGAIRAGRAPAARAVVEYVAGKGPGDNTLVACCPLNYPAVYYAQGLGGDAVRIISGRPPQAYTFDAFVAAPAGTTVREVVENATGGWGVVLSTHFVTVVSDVGLWRARICCPSPGNV